MNRRTFLQAGALCLPGAAAAQLNISNPFFVAALLKPASAQAGPYLTNLVGWYKADAESFSNNDPVGTFTDQSGNGNHLTNSGTARPTFKTGIQNGLPVVRFDGVDDFLNNTSLAGFSGTPAGCVIMMVSKVTNSGAFDMFASLRDATPLNYYELRLNSGGSKWQFIAYSGAAAATSTSSQSGFRCVTGMITDSDDLEELLLDTTSEDTNVAEAGSISITQGSMGGRAGTLFFDGDMAEMLIYNARPSESNLAVSINYLKSKWGV